MSKYITLTQLRKIIDKKQDRFFKLNYHGNTHIISAKDAMMVFIDERLDENVKYTSVPDDVGFYTKTEYLITSWDCKMLGEKGNGWDYLNSFSLAIIYEVDKSDVIDRYNDIKSKIGKSNMELIDYCSLDADNGGHAMYNESLQE